jgi:hypothetical protein
MTASNPVVFQAFNGLWSRARKPNRGTIQLSAGHCHEPPRLGTARLGLFGHSHQVVSNSEIRPIAAVQMAMIARFKQRHLVRVFAMAHSESEQSCSWNVVNRIEVPQLDSNHHENVVSTQCRVSG